VAFRDRADIWSGKETVIESLPEEWSEEAEEKAPEDAANYKELQSKLVTLNERRRAAEERLEQYRTVNKLLEPFHGEDAGLQENLVTKNGSVEKELERMRMLMLRVERGIMGLEEKDAREEMDIDVDDDKEKEVFGLLA
jgi:DNA repair exonuclease SbcCD ATPase subunit